MTRAILLLLMISVAGCGKEPAADDCLDLPVYPPAGVTDLRQTAQACLERTAATYAKGPDTPQAISEAVMARCQSVIMEHVTEAAREAGEKPQYGEVLEAWRQQALPVIAEARARRCYS